MPEYAKKTVAYEVYNENNIELRDFVRPHIRKMYSSMNRFVKVFKVDGAHEKMQEIASGTYKFSDFLKNHM